MLKTATAMLTSVTVMLCVLTASPAMAAGSSVAVGPRQGAWTARTGLTSGQLQQQLDVLKAAGYRPTDIDGYTVANQARYTAVFEKRRGPAWTIRWGMSSGQYQQEFDRRVAMGFRVVQVSGYMDRGQARYAALFEKRSGSAWVARHGMDAAAYQAAFDRYTAQGYRPVHIDVFERHGRGSFALVMEKRGGPAWQAKHGMSAHAYQLHLNNLTARGYRVVKATGYVHAGQMRFAAVWEKTNIGAWLTSYGLTAATLQQKFRHNRANGFSVSRIVGYGNGQFSVVWEKGRPSAVRTAAGSLVNATKTVGNGVIKGTRQVGNEVVKGGKAVAKHIGNGVGKVVKGLGGLFGR